jgi:AraC-like DNA-binding protein
MSHFFFEPPPLSDHDAAKREILEVCERTQEQLRGYPEEKALIRKQPWTRVCALFPTPLVLTLDEIAQDADVSRSLLLRHIAAEFGAVVREEGIRFHGSLFRADTREERKARYIK